MQGFLKLQLFDDIEAINFIASTLRKKSDPEEPIGKDFIENGNLLFALAVLRLEAIDYVNMSLPISKKGKKVKSNNSKEDIDLDWLYYCYTTILGKSEKRVLGSYTS